MDILKKLEELFGSDKLYVVLNVKKEDASDSKKLRSAYLRAALKFHPDKSTDEGSTEKFQLLKQVYELLQDEETRKYYNDTGKLPDEQAALQPDMFTSKLSEEAILDFKKIYIGSEEEKQDFIKHYNEGKGSLIYLFENMFFVDPLNEEDVARVKAMIEEAVKNGEVEEFPEERRFKAKWARFINEMKDESVEAAAMLAEMKATHRNKTKKRASADADVDDSLAAMILAKQGERSAFLDQLESKYANLEKNAKRKKTGKK